jgi:hypothetical protein
MTPAPLPVILACLAVAVTVSCDAGLVASQRVHADRTSPLGYCSITGRAARAGPCSGRSGLAFTAAVGGVLGGGGDRGGGGRLGLMAREEP